MTVSFVHRKLSRWLMQLTTALCVMVSAVVSAHQQKEAYTSILFNERSNAIEVAHRFYLHDAEHAIGDILGRGADLFSDAKSQHDFAEYIQQQFRLLDENQQLLALGKVGFEVEGKFFWVYQEIQQPKKLTAIYISMRALQDVWPGQINQVNVEFSSPSDGEKVRSVRLSSDDDWQRIDLNKRLPNDSDRP